MSDVKGYLKSRAPFALMVLLILAIAGILALLYEIPNGPFIHLAYVTLGLCGIFGAADFALYMKRLGDVRRELASGQSPSVKGEFEKALAGRIGELETELRDSTDASSARYNEMVDYYTIWAHQIKTPISALSLTAQNIEEDELRESLMTQIVRIEDYADMVMGYIRLDSESSDLVFKEQIIEDIVRREIKKQRSAILAKGLTLTFNGGENTAVTDSRWLGFAVGQVLSNSIKYTPAGKITINCSKDKILIEDDGIGIAPEDLPRVFEKGYTGYNGRSDKKSTGIGLYLVKRTMELIGGDIGIESEMGKGTKVTLYLTKT